MISTNITLAVVKNGKPGEGGRGIASDRVAYQKSTSGIVPPSGQWSDSPPEPTDGYFLWTRTTLVFTDDSESYVYSVSKYGDPGAPGAPGEPGEPGKPGKKGEPGENGNTTYFFTAWANNKTGTDGFTTNRFLAPEKKYMGTYASFNSVQSTDPTLYSWIATGNVFADEVAELQDEIAAVPEFFVQPTEPERAKKGDIWWKTNTEGNPIGFYKREVNEDDEGEWKEQEFEQSMLNIVSLTAVEINSATISGSAFLNYWDRVVTNGREGVARIEDGIFRTDFTTPSGGSGYVLFDDGGVRGEERDSLGNLLSGFGLNHNSVGMSRTNPLSPGNTQSAGLKADGLGMSDSRYPAHLSNAQMGYEALIYIPQTNLPASAYYSWFAQYSEAQRIKYGRSSDLVSVSGACRNINPIPAGGTEYTMFILPEGCRPERDEVMPTQHGSGANGFMVKVKTSGEVVMARYAKGGEYVQATTGSWLNISISFRPARIF